MKKLVIVLFLMSCIEASPQEKEFNAPGEFVDVGGYNIHLLVEGKDQKGPTVVFFHGAGDIALHWNLVLPKVGRFATAVAIDFAGEGWEQLGELMMYRKAESADFEIYTFDNNYNVKKAEMWVAMK